MTRRAHRGLALAVTLILLLVLTLLALSGTRLAALELRGALDDELRVAAYEGAQSLVDAALRSFNNTPVLPDGGVACARAMPDCTEVAPFTLPEGLAASLDAGEASLVIRAMPPASADPPVGTGYSAERFDAAYLRVEGRYDRRSRGEGRAEVHEGLAIVYGSAGEITRRSGAEALAEFTEE